MVSLAFSSATGYVGNKSAVFPLQLLGFDVDPINSVQFSNHTGYKNGWKGDVMNGTQLAALLEGLQNNNLVRFYTCLLTGYIGSVSFLRQVLDVLKALRSENPDVRYYCDPVLGDKGKLYVPAELIEVYKSEVVPAASVLTPNQFELELLTETAVSDLASAKAAFLILHRRGVKTVVLTSCDFEDRPDELILLASSITDDLKDSDEPRLIEAAQPKIDGHYTGTGDLIAALLLAWMERRNGDIKECVVRACATMHAVVGRTRHGKQEGINPNGELMLIQSRKDIEDPDSDASPVIVRELQ